MHVIAKRTLRNFWTSHRDSEGSLKAWFSEVKAANWKTPADVKAMYGPAKILKRGRVVFKICGNKYRLIVKINYDYKRVYIRFIGTHKQYDAINAEEI